MAKTELKKGIRIEREHFKSLKPFLKPGVKFAQVSKAIAKDHIKEDPKYYAKLKRAGLKDPNKTGLVVQKAQSPYLDNGKTRFNLRNTPGVYLVYENSKLVYVGFSASDVYKAMYRHFQKWTDKNQQRITFKDLKNITVRMVYTKTGSKARKLEGALILKHKPPLNINQYDGFITDESEKKVLKEFETAGIYTGTYDDDNPPF